MGTSTGRLLSRRLVEAIADANGIDPRGMDPLHEVIDLEALDELDQNSSADWTVGFSFSGNRIVVESDGTIRVDGRLYVR